MGTLTENATYEYYTGTLGRSAVPDEAAFNRHLLENRMYVESLYNDGIICGKYDGALGAAVCMCVEVDYLTAQALSGDAAPLAGENVSGYSYSLDNTARTKAVELNAKSAEAQKYRWIAAFCDRAAGWTV